MVEEALRLGLLLFASRGRTRAAIAGIFKAKASDMIFGQSWEQHGACVSYYHNRRVLVLIHAFIRPQPILYYHLGPN